MKNIVPQFKLALMGLMGGFCEDLKRVLWLIITADRVFLILDTAGIEGTETV
jgi:hypothetical protein